MTKHTQATASLTALINSLLTSIRHLRHRPEARADVRAAILRVRQLRGMVELQNATKELVVRETAAEHLHGIPAKQNQSAIDRLYDQLNHLHIARIEGGL